MTAPAPRTVVLVVVAVAALLGLVWTLLDDPARGASVAAAAAVAGAPIGYLLAARLPLHLVVRRGVGVGLRLDEPALVAADRVTAIVLDKTGTITSGELAVTSVDPVEPDHDRNLRWFAGALQHSAEDPVGRAIAKLAGRGHLTDVVHTPGLGTSGSVDRHPVRVGRPDWIGFDHPGGDGTTVAVEVDARALGHITVDDVVRDDAAESVQHLRDLGLDPVLVSDATAHNTDRLARAAGIEATHSELAPEKRARVVTDLQESGHVVAFVGMRGDNTEALDACDLAIGTDSLPAPAIGIDTLDAGVVARCLRTARTTLSVVRTNRAIGVATSVVGLGLAAIGVLPLWAAAGYAALAALAVVGNSLRVSGPAL